MMANTSTVATTAITAVITLPRLFSHRNTPITTMPSMAPRDWLPIAAMALSPMAAVNACLIHKLGAISCK